MNDTARLLFDLPVIAVPIFSSEQLFPIRRIYCIGRNYAAHAREMGSDPERDPPDALDCIFGYAVGLDMTRRDLQRAMGDAKKPWEIGKAFDHAAPIGPIVPASRTGHLKAGRIALSVNGKIRQQDDLSSMSWDVAEQIAKLSQAFRLEAGDIIFSGTPENVGPVLRGDVLAAEIEGLPDLSIRIV